ncbi:MAG: HAMP domain-containing protein [Anaerolineae bacterium]|nr:HAMP domain-containing protein [Anaerolineae bacterium]
MDFEVSWLEYLLLALYALVLLALLIVAWRDFRFGWRRLALFLGLLLAVVLVAFLTSVGLAVPFLAPDLPPPNRPAPPPEPFASLLALPVIATAAWVGAGPALLVGLLCGTFRTWMMTGSITDPFHFALFGFLVGFFLRQDYRGRLSSILRQPGVAGPLATLLASPFLLLSVFAHHLGESWLEAGDMWLAGLDYAVTLTGSHLVPMLLESLVAALIIQAIYLFLPSLVPSPAQLRIPPYLRTLNRRMLFLFVPLIMAMTIVLVYAVTMRTLDVATLEAVYGMERSATSAAEQIAYFTHIGQGLLGGFADDAGLLQDDPSALTARLQNDLSMLAFFNQLMLLDSDGKLLAYYPEQTDDSGALSSPELTDQEKMLVQRVTDQGAPQSSTVHRAPEGEVILSILMPVESGVGNRFGVLLGRVRLDASHPVLGPILESLQWIGTRGGELGEGFIVEQVGEKWQIIAHPETGMLLTEWSKIDVPLRAYDVREGEAYEGRNPRDNTRQLVYYLPVQGRSDWAVVVRLPYKAVQAQAAQIAAPLLGLQLLMGLGLIVVIPLVTSWLTRPLKQLATAARHIAEGDLTQSVQIPGADEVAQVGDAFESMRVRLKGRMGDLSLLLQVSQAVSATLELPRGMPFILEGVLKATQAEVARIVLLSADGFPQMVMSRGEPREGLGSLDRALAGAARGMETPLILENLARARSLTDETLDGSIKSVIALPVRTKAQVPAVMWVGYGEVRQFEPSEIDLLSTLASQTAVLVENARLFQSAEGGRRRLAAILASTTDAVLVTDRDDCLLLANPAAERAFGIEAERVIGQKIAETALESVLERIFGGPLSDSEALNEEVPLPDGRTLYASVSMILSSDGERIGRVAVMRDITHFKELDELKSDFVATVSHDLRAPLTFMRGYTTMLPMVGSLTEKQSEYVDKILQGVGQMSELIDDLLDLGRVEAGVGLERKPCHLGAILIEAVDGMRARAITKGLAVRLEPPEGTAVVSGDAALLRQMVANLVDNAIKYTPSDGVVTVSLSVHDKQAAIRVTDTGIGIAPDDQVRLFEKFYRIKRRDTADIPGTGLGLAIVKSIVERHGGRVWVESELNTGSTFHVLLPLAEPESLR